MLYDVRDLLLSYITMKDYSHFSFVILGPSEGTDKNSMSLDFDSKEYLGVLQLWDSGECYICILEASSGTDVLNRNHEFQDINAIHKAVHTLFILIRELKRTITKQEIAELWLPET